MEKKLKAPLDARVAALEAKLEAKPVDRIKAGFAMIEAQMRQKGIPTAMDAARECYSKRDAERDGSADHDSA